MFNERELDLLKTAVQGWRDEHDSEGSSLDNELKTIWLKLMGLEVALEFLRQGQDMENYSHRRATPLSDNRSKMGRKML